jgi:hypothetical protein
MAIISGGQVIAGALRSFTKAGALANGDFNGQAGTGATATDTTNGKLYINTGTVAATVWVSVGSQT